MVEHPQHESWRDSVGLIQRCHAKHVRVKAIDLASKNAGAVEPWSRNQIASDIKLRLQLGTYATPARELERKTI
jgi:hypothetical protein